MTPDTLLLQSKLTPPRLNRRVLPRPGLRARLLEALDYRLTVVHASTGYGKTTALSALDDAGHPLFWYGVEEADSDPQRFLSYLIAAFTHRLPGLPELPPLILQEGGAEGNREMVNRALDALINALTGALAAPSLLVLDDYHMVATVPEINALVERLIAYLPAELHVVLASRYPLELPDFLRWRARGEILEIDRRALAFQPGEIAALFRDTYGMALTPTDLTSLAERTEGWPIALQLVRQGLRNPAARSAAELLARSPASLGALFDYLARDVLARQPPQLAAFLRETAVLRELSPAAADVVRQRSDSHALLAQLHELDLFLVELGEAQYRYHHLFHDFLKEQAGSDPEGVQARHRRAAAFFEAQSNLEEAIFHHLAAADFPAAASVMEVAGERTLRAGQLDTLALWIDALPAPVLAARPRLQAYLGDLYRLRSRFDEALAWYQQAEQSCRKGGDSAGVSRALRGQALVYLDTVRPATAEGLLEEALGLTEGIEDRHSRSRLLELLAENKLNMGKPEEAESLRTEAIRLREDGPAEDVLGVRVKLRTGQLHEAAHILEGWLEGERAEVEHGQVHPPRAHRETALLLSLIYALRGQSTGAFTLAQEGLKLSERLRSPFTTAVAQMRLAHAWQLRAGRGRLPEQRQARDEAHRCYQRAISLGDELSVRRTRLEAMWGLTRLYGVTGELEAARQAAAEGVEIGEWAGDQWVVALGELALGAGYVLAACPQEAIDLLLRVLASFRACGDRFGRAATRLWLCLAYDALGQHERFAASADELLALCEANRYDFLFTAPSLLGPPDHRLLLPILLEARARGIRTPYVTRLLARMGLERLEMHPGYQLRVQALGGFRLWRGDEEIEPREWQRDKARQLFQLLLGNRERWLLRDEMVELLWPALAPDVATRDFKVALSAMNRTLEPERSAGGSFAFLARDGTAYRLRPESDLWIDAEQFEVACQEGLQARLAGRDVHLDPLERAMGLYQGPYLPDALYEDWAGERRDRLRTLFLRGGTALAELYLQQGRAADVVALCQRLLADDPCWEAAYRLLIEAYLQQGHRPLALRALQRCVEVLRDELGVAPSFPTLALSERIVQAE